MASRAQREGSARKCLGPSPPQRIRSPVGRVGRARRAPRRPVLEAGWAGRTAAGQTQFGYPNTGRDLDRRSRREASLAGPVGSPRPARGTFLLPRVGIGFATRLLRSTTICIILATETITQIATILDQHARLGLKANELGELDSLYDAGMTSHASVSVMLALEDTFDIEFPDSMLSRRVFESLASIS